MRRHRKDYLSMAPGFPIRRGRRTGDAAVRRARRGHAPRGRATGGGRPNQRPGSDHNGQEWEGDSSGRGLAVSDQAADSLLDREGRRGKPVEKVQQANFNFNTQEVRNELVQAIMDPGVRKWLDQNPEIKAQLQCELHQLALTGGGEAVVEQGNGEGA